MEVSVHYNNTSKYREKKLWRMADGRVVGRGGYKIKTNENEPSHIRSSETGRFRSIFPKISLFILSVISNTYEHGFLLLVLGGGGPFEAFLITLLQTPSCLIFFTGFGFADARVISDCSTEKRKMDPKNCTKEGKFFTQVSLDFTFLIDCRLLKIYPFISRGNLIFFTCHKRFLFAFIETRVLLRIKCG
ncbi:hypothetical protein QBC42DRAFT_22433 [Cladorrhinum samala]|uniref:Uncharacterized protein n=1 Tax=Cladorrhinum samala TaxID=585594 RepID=A0AAV9I1N3_9PEZI|nr:hypothetical protein QBC42DRAFT_22433 [Cladorrhinum samala]